MYKKPANFRRATSRRAYSYPKQTNKRKQGDYINPARFIKQAEPSEEASYEALNSFEDFELNQLIKNNLAANGYKVPTAIQDQTIPMALEGKDVVGIANTGTGKTAVFAVPILNFLISDRSKRALIIAPTRELAQQIEAEFRRIAQGSRIFGALLIGGASMGAQLRDLRSNPQVVIGTPGRIKDHTDRGSLALRAFNIIVLDEVDRMLDMGFINPITNIFGSVSPSRQSLFFSATLDERVKRLIDGFASEPVAISAKTGTTSSNVHQNIVKFESTSDKIDKLHNLLITSEVEKVIVFDETQRNVERLGKELASRGFQTDSIHGGKSQGQRQRALNRFKASEINVLVATNVAARGIDVADITHVINYSVPQTYDDYIHRIGRAGRAGKTGYALTFVPSGY
jgi:superfamily II DNA/RNA helicase